MEFKQLDAFVGVVVQKSFSKAAEKLFLTQPAVSHQIATLERELGAKLLLRNAKEVLPTKEGRVFYRHAVGILEKRAQAVQSIQYIQGDIGGTISIGASSIPNRHYLPRMLTDFQKKYCNILFRIYSHDSTQIVQDVADGKLDVGITGIYVPSAQCETKHMAYDRWIVVTPNTSRYKALIDAGFPIEKIIQERFICREPGSGTRKDVDHFLSQLGVRPGQLKIIAELDDTESIIKLVSEGLGISVVSQRAAETYKKFEKILTLELDQTIPARQIYLVCNKSITMSTAAQKFYEFALCYYQE